MHTVRVAIQYISAIVGMLLAARKLVWLLSTMFAGDLVQALIWDCSSTVHISW